MASPDIARVFKDELIHRLRALLDLRGESIASMEQRMGKGRGYVGDALREQKRLSLDVVLDMLEALQILPQDFFAGKIEEELRLERLSQEYDYQGAVVQLPRRGVSGDSSAYAAQDLSQDVYDGGEPPERVLWAVEPSCLNVEDVARVLTGLCNLLERKGLFKRQELIWALKDVARRWSVDSVKDFPPFSDPEGE